MLTDAGLVRVDRAGRQRRYVLRREHLGAVLDLWLASVGLRIETTHSEVTRSLPEEET